jgi:hypothetical protein
VLVMTVSSLPALRGRNGPLSSRQSLVALPLSETCYAPPDICSFAPSGKAEYEQWDLSAPGQDLPAIITAQAAFAPRSAPENAGGRWRPFLNEG